MSNLPKINRTAVIRVVEATLGLGARKATVYQGTRLVVRATRQFKKDRRNTRESVVLTWGRPNYAERKFIEACFKAGEPLPVKKVQLQWFPKKRRR